MLGIILLAVVGLVLLYAFAGARLVPNDRVAIVERRFGNGSVGKVLIALDGEAGYAPDLLRGGFHWLTPFMYRIHVVPLVTIPQG